VPGFANMFDLEFQSGMSREDNTRRRFWFTVPNVEIEENADGQSMVISALSINVKTEYLDANWETLENQPPDPAGQAFAAHISEHYDEYAQELSVFNDLKALAHWAALAHWLKQSNLPIQPELWLVNSPAEYNAPLTTPAITATRQETQGNIIRTMSLWGGVDLGMKVKIKDAQVATKKKLKEAADQFKARFMPVEANVSVGFAPVSPQGYKQSVSTQVELPFDLVSQISYSDNHWELRLPHLKRYGGEENSYFLLDDGKSSVPMLLTYDGYDEENKARIFTNHIKGERLSEFSDAYQVVHGSFEQDGVFVYTPGDFTLFDPQGQIVQDAVTGVEYDYKSGHLTGIRQGNQEIKINWNSDDTIRDIQSVDKKVSFDYKNGLLTDVTGAASHKFEYDAQGRLTRELDTEGKLISMTRYDAQNRISFHIENGEAELYDWTLDGEPKTYKGSALLPWQGASEKDLDDFKTALILNQDKRIDNILFVRRIDNKVVVFSNGSSYTVPDYLLKNPQRLRDKLKAISEELNKPGKVLVSTGNAREVAFQSLFPEALALNVEKMDKVRILKNLAILENAPAYTAATTSVINGVPLPNQLKQIGRESDDPGIWLDEDLIPWKNRIDEIITQSKFTSSTAPSAAQITSAFSTNPSILFIVTHFDKTELRLPDGSTYNLLNLSKEEKRAIAANHPLVVLLSCDTATPDTGDSFAQQLLELGPYMVIAPNGEISVKDAYRITEAFSQYAKPNVSAWKAFQEIIHSVYDGWIISTDGGIERFFEFRTWTISPQNMES
jgi:YD repeat-containing protein